MKEHVVFLLMNFVIMSAVFFMFASSQAGAAEEQWQRIGTTADKSSVLYIDASSKVRNSDDTAVARAKEELSPERFHDMVAKAEKDSGAKVEDPDKLYAILVKSLIQYSHVTADCVKNKYTMQAEKANSPMKIVIEDTAKPGTTEYEMIQFICK